VTGKDPDAASLDIVRNIVRNAARDGTRNLDAKLADTRLAVTMIPGGLHAGAVAGRGQHRERALTNTLEVRALVGRLELRTRDLHPDETLVALAKLEKVEHVLRVAMIQRSGVPEPITGDHDADCSRQVESVDGKIVTSWSCDYITTNLSRTQIRELIERISLGVCNEADKVADKDGKNLVTFQLIALSQEKEGDYTCQVYSCFALQF
jgi:hypothetical protein